MRISLVHGEDKAKAYSKYRELVEGSKAKGFEIIPIQDIKNVSSQSLFEDKLVFTLDNANKIKLNDWKWLKENASHYNSNLLIYFQGNAPATVTNNLPKDIRNEKFELPKFIFKFLDSLFLHNSKNALKLFNEVCQTEPTELVFHLMARQFRDLYWVLIGKDEVKLPIWRISKLSQIAGKFGHDNLRRIISDLAEIDIKVKTSDTDLKTSLDFFIVKHLE